MLCVDCGAEVPKTIKGSCPTCFTKQTPLLDVPDVIDVELCAHCDARHVGAHWVDPQEGMPLAWIREEAVRDQVGVHRRVQDAFLQFDEVPQDDKHFQVHIQLEGRVEGADIVVEDEVLVRQKKGVCDRCSRLFGDYFAAIIQLRATERDVREAELERAHAIVAEEMENQRRAGNRFAFVSKDGPQHGGWDYFVGDIEAARQACRILKTRLGATVQETAKLVGRKEGEDVHRVTFLVRIRLFANGDFALHKDGRLLQVQGQSHGRVSALDLIHHRKTRVQEADLRRLGGPELVQEAVLVSVEETDLQVLDPSTFKTQDVLRPDGFFPDGETVPVLRHEERLYIPPSPPGDSNKT